MSLFWSHSKCSFKNDAAIECYCNQTQTNESHPYLVSLPGNVNAVFLYTIIQRLVCTRKGQSLNDVLSGTLSLWNSLPNAFPSPQFSSSSFQLLKSFGAISQFLFAASTSRARFYWNFASVCIVALDILFSPYCKLFCGWGVVKA